MHAPACTNCRTSERSICTKHYSNAIAVRVHMHDPASASTSPSSDGADLVRTDTNSEVVQGAEVCSICFDQACAIEVRECGHQMCAACTLALCCHAKPNPATQSQPLPTCPFCRGGITR
uniref:RING-type E3 ubiquitin transferase n=1 Tax=Aegilops tauschii subsp. strangulata TaxID=200361 RepID=A0A453IDY7_AEGTS